MKTSRTRALLLTCLLIGGLGLLPSRASASDAGWRVGSVLSTLAYAPLKAGYAAMGSLFGGIGWALSGGDPGIVDSVITPAVRGDYVVTPAHLRGERRLDFVGGLPGAAEPDPGLAADPEPGSPYADAYYGYPLE